MWEWRADLCDADDSEGGGRISSQHFSHLRSKLATLINKTDFLYKST